MNVCPKCAADVPAMAGMCTACGFDLLSDRRLLGRYRWAYGRFSAVMLRLAYWAALLHVCVQVYAFGASLYNGDYFSTFALIFPWIFMGVGFAIFFARAIDPAKPTGDA